MSFLKRIIRKIVNGFGYEIISNDLQFPIDLPEDEKTLCRELENLTLSNYQAMWTLTDVVKYIVTNNIPGDIVECGIWKGGSIMAITKTLVQLNNFQKNIYLYDTFEGGMSNFGDLDTDFRGDSAKKIYEDVLAKTGEKWCSTPLEEVKKNVFSTKYPEHKFKFIKGKVEDTIPKHIPEKISILRLDTDFYESTKHELIHLFPRLSKYGILIIDDYGHWSGSRKAVDEYLKNVKPPLFLLRISRDGVRLALKC